MIKITTTAVKTHADRKRFIADTTKRRDELVSIDAELDRVIGRVIRWTNKLGDLRAKRKRRERELAKLLAS